MIQIDPKRLKRFQKLTLKHGAHDKFAAGACAMEAAAYLAGEKHSDHPECVCPVIAAFLRRWNDDLDDKGRQMLKPYVAKVLGTRATPEIEAKRAWLATDWMVRVHTPAWLDLAGLTEQANALRALPEITKATVGDGMPAIRDAQKKAAAAWDAARAAAWAAAWDAAGDAARAAAWAAAGDAARAAAWAAAGDAARAAARDAAGAAAWDAAGKKLAPVVKSLQASAFELLDRMIALSASDDSPKETK